MPRASRPLRRAVKKAKAAGRIAKGRAPKGVRVNLYNSSYQEALGRLFRDWERQSLVAIVSMFGRPCLMRPREEDHTQVYLDLARQGKKQDFLDLAAMQGIKEPEVFWTGAVARLKKNDPGL